MCVRSCGIAGMPLIVTPDCIISFWAKGQTDDGRYANRNISLVYDLLFVLVLVGKTGDCHPLKTPY